MLWSDSEVVCIGAVTSTKVVENSEFLPKYLEGLESEIRIHAVLKGDKPLKTIKFLHFRYRDGVATLGNGPSFPVLRDRAADTKRSPTFLFFLKSRPDGRFAPTTGDDDASISVAQILGYTNENLLPLNK